MSDIQWHQIGVCRAIREHRPEPLIWGGSSEENDDFDYQNLAIERQVNQKPIVGFNSPSWEVSCVGPIGYSSLVDVIKIIHSFIHTSYIDYYLCLIIIWDEAR
jgi:hypothetical protein